MAKTGAEPAGHLRQPVLRRHGRRRRTAARLRDRGHGQRRHGRRRQDRQARRRERGAHRDRGADQGDRKAESMIAGSRPCGRRSDRFGVAETARCSLRGRRSARLCRAVATSSSCSARTRGRDHGAGRPLPGLGARPGRKPPLRARGARRCVEAAVVVLADGPTCRRTRSPRDRRVAGSGRRGRCGDLRRQPGPPGAARPQRLGAVPDEGAASCPRYGPVRRPRRAGRRRPPPICRRGSGPRAE